MDLMNTRTSFLQDRPAQTVKPRPSGISLWRPEIVLPETITTIPERGRVVIAEPAQRPEAVRAQLDATRNVLESLAEAHDLLATRAAAFTERGAAVESERERVAAMIETYRATTALEDVLQGTLRQVSALMGERGRR
jgi:hypothetical protein